MIQFNVKDEAVNDSLSMHLDDLSMDGDDSSMDEIGLPKQRIVNMNPEANPWIPEYIEKQKNAGRIATISDIKHLYLERFNKHINKNNLINIQHNLPYNDVKDIIKTQRSELIFMYLRQPNLSICHDILSAANRGVTS